MPPGAPRTGARARRGSRTVVRPPGAARVFRGALGGREPPSPPRRRRLRPRQREQRHLQRRGVEDRPIRRRLPRTGQPGERQLAGGVEPALGQPPLRPGEGRLLPPPRAPVAALVAESSLTRTE